MPRAGAAIAVAARLRFRFAAGIILYRFLPSGMDARRWDQFLSFLDRARSKPTFDAEERQYRLQIAEEPGRWHGAGWAAR